MKPGRFTAPPAACVALVVLTAATAALFAPTLTYPWLAWDDGINVARNPGLNPVTWDGLAGFWLRPYEQLYIPVSYSFFAAETVASRLLSGRSADQPLSPVLFHACSIALHAIAGLLVWRLLGRIGLDDRAARLCAAALFLCHPLQVEAVAWISDQRGLLAAVFSLAALDVGLGTGGGAARQGSWRTALALGCFGLATLSKPQAVSVPLLLFLLDGRTWREPVSRTALRALPWALAVVVVLAVTAVAQPADGVAARAPIWLRPIVAGDALFHYALSLVVPLRLAIDYGRIPDVVLADPWSYGRAAVGVAGLVAVAGAPGLDRWRLPLALAIVPLLPVLGFLPFAFQGISTVADRYAYLAMVGPALAFGRLASRSARVGRWGLVVAVTCLAACCVMTHRQVQTWSSSAAVFSRAIEVNPRSFVARLGLAGEMLRAERYAEAIVHFDAAIAVDSQSRDLPKAYYGRALALHRSQNLQAAGRDYVRALNFDRGNADLRNDYGILLAQQGMAAEAAEQFEAAVRLRPEFTEAAQNLRAARAILAEPPAK